MELREVEVRVPLPAAPDLRIRTPTCPSQRHFRHLERRLGQRSLDELSTPLLSTLSRLDNQSPHNLSRHGQLLPRFARPGSWPRLTRPLEEDRKDFGDTVGNSPGSGLGGSASVGYPFCGRVYVRFVAAFGRRVVDRRKRCEMTSRAGEGRGVRNVRVGQARRVTG
ncbi:hypothetical protein BJY59DRAFT_105915 [Rhodotorula toruloides]